MTQEEWATELTNQTDGIIAAAWGIVVIIGIIALIIGIIQLIANWNLYKKCGRKGWEAIIPFYGTWIKMVEIAKLNWWWFLIGVLPSILLSSKKDLTTIISLVTLFTAFQCNYNIAKKFHKDTGFAILMTLFPTILYLMLAFSKNYVYDDSVPVSKNGIIDSKNTETNTNYNNNTNNYNNNQNYNNQTTNNTNISYCSNCGTQINDGIKYCPKCGNEIK